MRIPSPIRIAAMATLFPGWLVLSSAALAQERFEEFFPLLVDLPGWTGSKPTGQTMIIPGLVIALREYQRGDLRLYANVTAGPGRLTEPAPAMTIETSERRLAVSVIDGWQVGRTFDFKDKSSAITISLGNGYLMLLAKGVAEDAALTLARRFDWKALQTV